MAAKGLTIDGYSENHLLKRAAEIVEEKSQVTAIFDSECEERIPKFDNSELFLGKVLGRGGFCVVNEITSVTLKEGEASKLSQRREVDEHRIANIVQDRNFMEAHCIRKGKDYRYAIKKLKDDVTGDAQTFVSGVVDLAIEARFLAVIRHPNIIKMRAICVGTPFSRNYFVVLDRLYDILTKRLATWKKRRVGGVRKLLDRKGKKQVAFWVERVTVAYDLSCALRYLHDLNILYRDLKPDNIGFDVRGDVKIFDFGLAKEINRDTPMVNGLYRLTGDTGSPRYMAPEVALEKPYNESVDVYSFSILLHQILALETPFEVYTTVRQFEKKVVRGGVRPKCDPKWPERLQNTMRNGWSTNIGKRPTMEDLSSVLRDEIAANSDDEINDANDVSRKSEISLRKGS